MKRRDARGRRTTGAGRRLRAFLRASRGPGFFLVWSIVPIQAVPDGEGRTRVTVGYGQGRYQAEWFDATAGGIGCLGVPVVDLERHEAPVEVTSVGGSLEYWPGDTGRLSLSAGYSSLTWADLAVPRPMGFDSEESAFSFSGLLATERENWGVGAGIGIQGGVEDSDFRLPLYLRAGPLDRFHARAELSPVVSTPVSGANSRLGLAFGMGPTSRLRVYAGYVGGSPFEASQEGGGGFAEVGFPVGRRLDVGASVLTRSTRSSDSDWAFGVFAGFRQGG